MRNALRFLSLLLVCVLAVSLWAPAAKADMCYEVIKLIFEDDEDDTFTYLGKGTEFETDPSDYVFFLASTAGEYVGVTGTSDITGRYEGYAWYDVTAKEAFLAFLDFCLSYETLSGLLTEDDGLHGALFLTEDGDPIVVSSASDAAAFIEAVEEYLSE